MTFRVAAGFAAVLASTLLIAFILVYWHITSYELARLDKVLANEAALLASMPPAELRQHVSQIKIEDMQLVINAAGLFDAAHRHLAGNLATWPGELPADKTIRLITGQPFGVEMRAVAVTLPDATTLVLARSIHGLTNLRALVLRALETCAIPAIILSLLGGFCLSHRALRRIEMMHRAVERIMNGDLQERLPVNGTYDEMERLAGSVNRMVDRIEHLVSEIKGVGDDIAHDLRTPLARVRNHLDRSRMSRQSVEALEAVIDRSIIDLDQCFAVITALLRIGEIDNGQRRAAFGMVDLTDVAANIFDLYEPIAEEKGVVLRFDAAGIAGDADRFVHGDRDLLIEAAANLVDNAVKFTPSGGCVVLAVKSDRGHPILQVTDNGPGIAETERNAVLRRFYRSDKSRHLPGSGLGLSLVMAIVSLHDCEITVLDGAPGSIFRLSFPAVAVGFS